MYKLLRHATELINSWISPFKNGMIETYKKVAKNLFFHLYRLTSFGSNNAMTLFNIEITGCNVKPKRYCCIFIKSSLFCFFFFYNFLWLQSIYDAITALRIFVKAIKAYAWRKTYPDRNIEQKSLITRVITKTKQHEQHILILYVSLFMICVKTFCFYKNFIHCLF